jgi:AcrR family transcriptional regulator
MAGLRDRKKREARHRIIIAAASLVAENGLDETTMEDIAGAADVSVGTVYNYFGTKSALLLAGVEEDTDRMIAAGQAVLDNPGPDPAEAARRLSHVYLDDLVSWDKRLLREVMVAAFERVDGRELTAELARQDERLIEQMASLLHHFHQDGMLGHGVEVMEAVMVLFSVFALQLFSFMNLEGAEVSHLYAQIGRQIELVFAGIGRESG